MEQTKVVSKKVIVQDAAVGVFLELETPIPDAPNLPQSIALVIAEHDFTAYEMLYNETGITRKQIGVDCGVGWVAKTRYEEGQIYVVTDETTGHTAAGSLATVMPYLTPEEGYQIEEALNSKWA